MRPALHGRRARRPESQSAPKKRQGIGSMTATWITIAAERATEAYRTALRALGLTGLPHREGEPEAAALDVRVLPVFGGSGIEAISEELHRDDMPTLLLAATNEEELAAQRLARAQDDVARVGDAPESLMLRLQRLSGRQL
eukprot:gene16942-20716_t